MAPPASKRISLCCLRSLLPEAAPPSRSRRSFVTVQRGPVERLPIPPNLPQQYWSQLPKRLRPDRGRYQVHTWRAWLTTVGKREIIVHKPPPSEYETCKDPVKVVDDQQLALLDPTGARAKLFSSDNPDRAKPGDILHTTFKTGEPFSGVIMSIKGQGPHQSVLLRNQLTRIGTEMSIKVHSPLVQSMEVAQRAVKRARRARLYYLRKPKHDVGSVQKIVDQYLRERALLTGRKMGQASPQRQQRKKKR